MKTAGIICEYNPYHMGHLGHIEYTRSALGHDSAIVCIMSGNFVQRGDFAVFNKHARAETAVRCGADLVLEMPLPYVLSSAEGFASAGVYILDKLRICGYISFGSESGDLGALKEAAEAMASTQADAMMKEWLDKGFSYASSRQKAADAVLGSRSDMLMSPNNLLGIEYLKSMAAYDSQMQPMTIKRIGGMHDGETGYSASALRNKLLHEGDPWKYMPPVASAVYKKEIAGGQGPVSTKMCELAILSRLRAVEDFSKLPGASEGLWRRISRYAASGSTIEMILESIKTKRYAMSRLRRMLMCACLGLSALDTQEPPPYIRVLAMNRTGMRLLKEARRTAELPIITKPASVKKMQGSIAEMFMKEAASTDLYVLAYPDENKRQGGQEWQKGPVIVT